MAVHKLQLLTNRKTGTAGDSKELHRRQQKRLQLPHKGKGKQRESFQNLYWDLGRYSTNVDQFNDDSLHVTFIKSLVDSASCAPVG